MNMSLEIPKKEGPKSSIEKVVGVPKLWEDAILAYKGEVFDSQNFYEAKNNEKEKTSEDFQIIKIANDVTNELRREYGMDNFDIPAKNIHIVSEKDWRKEDDNTAGFYEQRNQAITIRDQYSSRLKFLSIIVHELLHFKSYNAMQASLNNRGELDFLDGYRGGFQVISRDGNKTYFTGLNEAITEELTKRLLSKLISELERDNLFADEIKGTKDLVKKIAEEYPDRKTELTADIIYAAPDFPKNINSSSLKKFIYRMICGTFLSSKTENYVYSRQRRMLNSLIDKVWKAHQDEFKNRDEVFNIFVKAYITGNLLPIGRMIEETFGNGSFRRIGELEMGTRKHNVKKERV